MHLPVNDLPLIRFTESCTVTVMAKERKYGRDMKLCIVTIDVEYCL